MSTGPKVPIVEEIPVHVILVVTPDLLQHFVADYTVLVYTSSIVLSLALQPQKSNKTTMAKEQPSFSIITHIGPSVAVLQMSSGQGDVHLSEEMALKTISSVHSSTVYSSCNRDAVTLPTSNPIIKMAPQATRVWRLFFPFRLLSCLRQ